MRRYVLYFIMCHIFNILINMSSYDLSRFVVCILSSAFINVKVKYFNIMDKNTKYNFI